MKLRIKKNPVKYCIQNQTNKVPTYHDCYRRNRKIRTLS